MSKETEAENTVYIPIVRGTISPTELARLSPHPGYTPSRKAKAIGRARSIVKAVMGMYEDLDNVAGYQMGPAGEVSIFWKGFSENVSEHSGEAAELMDQWAAILNAACEMYNEAKEEESPIWKVEWVPREAVS